MRTVFTSELKSGPRIGLAMRRFSQRTLDIQPTGVRKMFDMAGDDVISFGLGEPDFQPPPVAIEVNDSHSPVKTIVRSSLYDSSTASK